MRKMIRLNAGITDGIEGVKNPGNRGGNQKATHVLANPGESLGSIVVRALGYNSIEARERVLSANSSLDGVVTVPKG